MKKKRVIHLKSLEFDGEHVTIEQIEKEIEKIIFEWGAEELVERIETKEQE